MEEVLVDDDSDDQDKMISVKDKKEKSLKVSFQDLCPRPVLQLKISNGTKQRGSNVDTIKRRAREKRRKKDKTNEEKLQPAKKISMSRPK